MTSFSASRGSLPLEAKNARTKQDFSIPSWRGKCASLILPPCRNVWTMRSVALLQVTDRGRPRLFTRFKAQGRLR